MVDVVVRRAWPEDVENAYRLAVRLAADGQDAPVAGKDCIAGVFVTLVGNYVGCPTFAASRLLQVGSWVHRGEVK